MDSIRKVRDDSLAETEAGRSWVQLYDHVQLPVAAALLRDPAAAKEAAVLLRRAAGLTRKNGVGKLTDETSTGGWPC